MVYVLLAPLYGWREGKEYKFADTLEEIPENIRRDKSKFTRYKGLGEFDADEYHEACMVEKNRRLIRLEYPEDLVEFNNLMANSSDKKELLTKLGKIVTR